MVRQTAPRGACHVLLAGVVSLLLVGPASAAPARTVVVFTVDVESNETFPLPDQMDAICNDGSACGLMEIARLLGDRRWPGTFFLNVYEQRQWGQDAMRRIALRLEAAGQDVQLHTHPDSAYDPSRSSMHEYSLDEQTAIVRDGVRLLQAWTGQSVVAHRAGAYAADERTLIALERNGVLVDSSVFWKNPNSRLDAQRFSRNLPTRHGRLAEIPVTVYEREDRPMFLGAAFAPVTAVRKIDPDWFINVDEMRAAIDAAVEADIPFLVVFLHSFSFMASRTHGAPLADHQSIDIFRAMLDHIAGKNLPMMTMREIAQQELPLLPPTVDDVVPRVAVRVDVPHYVWRRMKASNGLSLSTGLGVTLLSMAALLVLVRRRKAIKVGSRPEVCSSPTPDGARLR